MNTHNGYFNVNGSLTGLETFLKGQASESRFADKFKQKALKQSDHIFMW